MRDLTTPVLTRDQVVDKKKKKRKERKSQKNNRAGKRYQMKDGYEKGEWAQARREESSTRRAHTATVDCRAAGNITTTCSEMQVRMGTATAPAAGGHGSGEAAPGDLLLPLILPPLNFDHRQTHGQSAASMRPRWVSQFRNPRSPSSAQGQDGLPLSAAGPQTKRNILTTTRQPSYDPLLRSPCSPVFEFSFPPSRKLHLSYLM